MTKKRIALIGNHPADYYHRFAQALECSGFQVFWVHGTRGAAKLHKQRLSTPVANILDTTDGFHPIFDRVEVCRNELTELEGDGNPRINDIVLMDRVLRRKGYPFALCYLNHLQRVLSRFFSENAVALVSSGRDTALQLISMLVCRKLGIPWVAPTRVRIPLDMYMFTSGHETGSVVDIRPITNEDRSWAQEFLQNFSRTPSKPALKTAARTFGDVGKMLPKHARLFFNLLKMSFADYGNDYSRYTIPRIVWMYLRRRLNMIAFKAFPPYSPVGTGRFCLYALHTQPESSIDVAGSYFSDQVALITFIARSIPISHELYVKIHPTDVDGKSLLFYRRIARLPGVRLINYDVDSRQLVQRASIIFTLTGTIGYEAALLGRPVVTFANNFFNQMPTVRHCDSLSTLPALVESLLQRKTSETHDEQQIKFLSYLKARSFDGEFNRMYLPTQAALTADDLRTLAIAYDTIFETLVPADRLIVGST